MPQKDLHEFIASVATVKLYI